jgi:hypothetical protein
MTVRRTAAALVVVPLLTLASCGGDPHKPPPLTLSPSPTQSPSPTPTGPVAPTMPAAAKAKTAAGAKAFVEYYWQVVNYAQSTGDTAPLKALSATHCSGCNGGNAYIERVYHKHGTIRGGHNSTKTTSARQVSSNAELAFQVLVTVSQARYVEDYPGKSKDYVSPAQTFHEQFIVTFEGSGWTATYLGEAPS